MDEVNLEVLSQATDEYRPNLTLATMASVEPTKGELRRLRKQGDQCEELTVPADAYIDFVNGICTFHCFDDLDCPTSKFNWLPGGREPDDTLPETDFGDLGSAPEGCETLRAT